MYEGQNPPADIEELKERIRRAHRGIGRNEIRKAVKALKSRTGKCILADGGHFEGKKLT